MTRLSENGLRSFRQFSGRNSVNSVSESAFGATTSAHGLYNTQQFVMRLSPLIHRQMASFTPGIITNGELGFECARAMSIYAHETIHWWQHVGSTYGLLLSLNYPIQSHSTHFDLKKIAGEDGFKKSILLQATELSRRGPQGLGTPAGTANLIVNNHFDLLTFRAFTLGPEAARDVVEDKLFEAVGHSLLHDVWPHARGLSSDD